MSTESAVRDRYANAAQAKKGSLCCAVDYDARFLEAIPDEVIERDYGCGDPSRYLREGETVLDLGSGTGKICFIASQVVGPNGRVIGVDMTDLENQSFNRFSEIVDLFSPNGVYQLLLEDRLTGDSAPHLESRFIWLAAALWTLVPALLFTARFRGIRP